MTTIISCGGKIDYAPMLAPLLYHFTTADGLRGILSDNRQPSQGRDMMIERVSGFPKILGPWVIEGIMRDEPRVPTQRYASIGAHKLPPSGDTTGSRQ